MLQPLTPINPRLTLQLADVVVSPDFGLTVLALCAPSIAYFVDGEDGQPHMILALLPFPLLMAQWGMLLTVFYQSIEDCKFRNPFFVSIFCSHV